MSRFIYCLPRCYCIIGFFLTWFKESLLFDSLIFFRINHGSKICSLNGRPLLRPETAKIFIIAKAQQYENPCQVGHCIEYQRLDGIWCSLWSNILIIRDIRRQRDRHHHIIIGCKQCLWIQAIRWGPDAVVQRHAPWFGLRSGI